TDDTDATVNFFGRELSSPAGGLIVDAEHTSQRFIVATDSSVGRIVPFFKAFTVAAPKTQTVDNAKGIGKNLAAIFKGALGKKGGGNGSGNDSKGLLDQILGFELNKYLTGGFAGTFMDVDFGAAVTIGSNASLTSEGDMTINARSVIADTNLQTTGASRSIANENATVNAAAQVALFDNTATVTIASGERALSAGGDMNITADAFKDYGRITSMVTKVGKAYTQLLSDVGDIQDICEAISKYGFADFAADTLEKTVADNLANVKNSFDSLVGTIRELYEKVTGIAVTAADLSQTSTWEALGAGDNFKEVADNSSQTVIGLCLKAMRDVAAISTGITDIQDAFTQATTVDTSAVQAVVAPFTNTASSAIALLTSGLDFISPGNYSDFFVSTKANDASAVYNAVRDETNQITNLVENTAEGAAAQISAGGNLNVATMNNIGIVSIGKRELTAGADLNVAANTESESVTLAGLQLMLFNAKAAKGGSALAGTLNFQNSDLDSIVTIADGAALTAGTAPDPDKKLTVKATGDNELYEVAMSAGKGANAFSGSLSFMWGHGNNVVAIDDGVTLDAPSIVVLSNGNTIAAEFVGGLGLGSSTASAGASIAVNAFSTNTVAAIANAADTLALVYGDEVKNSDGTYSETYVLTDDNTVGDTKVSSLLLGTDTGNKGSITTDALSVKAHNTGAIATLTVAGAVATPGDNADNSDPDKPTSKFGYVKNALTLGTAGGREKAGITLANKLFGANSILGQVTEKL
ncbi:MAG: hypothetical protein IJU32_09315, partial [Pyramidobacter sp.]|nr:hypothetical protein [Pyramidobacter sp.]